MDSFFVVVIALVAGGAIGWHSHISVAEDELKRAISKVKEKHFSDMDKALELMIELDSYEDETDRDELKKSYLKRMFGNGNF